MVFINKLWNASRFVDGSTELQTFDFEKTAQLLEDRYDELMLHEKWILSKLVGLTELVTTSMENYSFSEAGMELYTFTKNRFCDYYIEEFKLAKDVSKLGQEVILYSMNVLLRLWHPYIPFVTEELYNKL